MVCSDFYAFRPGALNTALVTNPTPLNTEKHVSKKIEGMILENKVSWLLGGGTPAFIARTRGPLVVHNHRTLNSYPALSSS